LVALRSGATVRLISVFKVSPDFDFPSITKNVAHGNLWQTSGVDP